MADATARVQVGRVIFLPGRWVVQSLRSHSANVALLATAWKGIAAFRGHIPDLSRTHDRLVEAARVHDMAKPARFRLRYEQDPWGRWTWQYSFAGHRFEAFHEDGYVQALAQLHHEYSVGAITRHVARLRLDREHAAAENLPLDLYALEMCDQIEATMARAVLGASDPEQRVFMDFQFRARASGGYEIDPFAFGAPPARLALEYAELAPPHEAQQAVEGTLDEGKRRAALREIERWLLDALQVAPMGRTEVELWPWME